MLRNRSIMRLLCGVCRYTLSLLGVIDFMKVPAYTQNDADRMIAAAKFIDGDMWDRRGPGQKPRFGGNAESLVTLECRTEDPELNYKFEIEIRYHHRLDTMHFLLKGRIGNGPYEGLCRFDLHDSPHFNQPPCEEYEAPPREPHCHRFNLQAFLRYGVWHKCARRLEFTGKTDNAERAYKAMLHQFLDELSIRIRDSPAGTGLFGHWRDSQ